MPPLLPRLRGPAPPHPVSDPLLPHLDGRHTALDLAELAGLSPFQVQYALWLLEDQGRLEPEPPPRPAQVVEFGDPDIDGIHRRALADGRPWILVRPGAWIGPRFTRDTACWACLAPRLPARPPSGGALDYDPARLPDGLLVTVDGRAHEIPRRPHCPACGTPPDLGRLPAAPSLEAPTAGGHESSRRSVDVETTLRRLRPALGGIVSDVRRLDAPGAPVFAALPAGSRQHAAGKGATESHALAGAIAEAVEHYSGVFQGDEPRRRARGSELDAVAPNEVLLYSERQFREREAWNASGAKYAYVPEPYADEEIDWTPLWSLTRGRVRWLPTGQCWYRVPRPDGRRLTAACSNGCASGNAIAEALLHGLLELVERDAVALWWYPRASKPSIASELPIVRSVRGALAARGRRMWMLDLRSDLDIPVVAAISAENERKLLFAFGAHVDPGIAVVRAVTELAQVEANHGEGAGDETFRRWWASETLETQTYLAPGPLRALPPARGSTLEEDLARVRSAVEAANLEILLLDQSRPEAPLRTVRAVVPGLRHFWPRFAPGRLYDGPLREDQLNPIPMFL